MQHHLSGKQMLESENIFGVYCQFTQVNIYHRITQGYDDIMAKTLNIYYNFCIIDLRMDVQFLERLSKTKYSEMVRKSIRIYKTWGLTGLVIFMDGCNAAKLWEQHKFYENIINEPHSYIFSHDIYKK